MAELPKNSFPVPAPDDAPEVEPPFCKAPIPADRRTEPEPPAPEPDAPVPPAPPVPADGAPVPPAPVDAFPSAPPEPPFCKAPIPADRAAEPEPPAVPPVPPSTPVPPVPVPPAPPAPPTPPAPPEPAFDEEPFPDFDDEVDPRFGVAADVFFDLAEELATTQAELQRATAGMRHKHRHGPHHSPHGPHGPHHGPHGPHAPHPLGHGPAVPPPGEPVPSRPEPPEGVDRIGRGTIATLRYLTVHDGEASPSAIASDLKLSNARISNILAVLEKRGWITREHDEADRRKVLVRLTEEGEGHVETVSRAVRNRLASFLSDLGEEDSRQLIAVLKRVTEVAKERRDRAIDAEVQGLMDDLGRAER